MPAMVTIVGEAVLIGIASGLALEETFQILTVLAFPPFTAALRRGARGALTSLVTELFGLCLVVITVTGGLSMPAATSVVTWTIFSLGLALIGTFIQATYREPVDPLDSYRNAQALIRELIGLSDELNRGLEPVTLAASIASAVHDELPVRGRRGPRAPRRTAHSHHQRPRRQRQRGECGRGARGPRAARPARSWSTPMPSRSR